MLDWKLIETAYPKAYNKLVGENSENQIWVVDYHERRPLHKVDNDDDIWSDRPLYDFFDEQGIWVSIEFSSVNRFDAKIEAGMFQSYYLGNKGDRKWAEKICFTSAFELLEEKL